MKKQRKTVKGIAIQPITKKNEIWIHDSTWITPKNIVQSETT